MSEIKAGDLVMVVRGMKCCGTAKGVGHVFVVASVEVSASTCGHCGARSPERRVAFHPSGAVADLCRLIRIDPPAQPESVETDREVVA